MLLLFALALNIFCKSEYEGDTGKIYSVSKRQYAKIGPDNYIISLSANSDDATIFRLEAKDGIRYVISELNSSRVLDYRYSTGQDVCIYNRHGGINQTFQFIHSPSNKMLLSVSNNVCLMAKDDRIVKGNCNDTKNIDYEFCWEPENKKGYCANRGKNPNISLDDIISGHTSARDGNHGRKIIII